MTAPSVSQTLVDDISRRVMERAGKRLPSGEIRFRCLNSADHNNSDAHPSARWNPEKAAWCCDACKVGGGAVDLAKRLGIEIKRPAVSHKGPLAYVYRDGEGNIAGRVVRQPGKRFYQERYESGEYRPGLNGHTLPLYRLPQIVNASDDEIIYIVEGEKDAERLHALGLIATTNAAGAGKFRPEHAEMLSGRQVVVVPDNDETGRKHAESVVRECRGLAASVRIVTLPGLPESGDVSNWLDNGGSVEALQRLVVEHSDDHHDHVLKGRDHDDDDPIDLSSVPDPGPVVFLVHGFLPAGYATNLYANSGQGKSYLALHLARCLIEGEPFLGRDVIKGPVLFLDWELDTDMQRRRWGEVCRGAFDHDDHHDHIPRGCDGDDDDLPRGLHYRRMRVPLIDALGKIRTWQATIAPVLTIIDSVGKALGDDPNDTKAILAFYSALDDLGTTLPIDHQARSGDGGYASKWEFGNSYKRHLARGSWQLERVGGDIGTVGLVLRHKKSNFGPLAHDIHATLTFSSIEDQPAVRLTTADGADVKSGQFGLRSTILGLLGDDELTAAQLDESIDEAEIGSIRNTLTELKYAGLIHETGKRDRAAVYGLIRHHHHDHTPREYDGDDRRECVECGDVFESRHLDDIGRCFVCVNPDESFTRINERTS